MTLLSFAGLLLIALGAFALYLASPNQRLLAQRPSARPLLVTGLALLAAGLAGCIAEWGGIVGGLLALAVWMTVSLVLPYALARRSL